MTPKMLLLPILLPAVLAVVLLLLPRALRLLRDVLAVAGAAVLLYYGFVFFSLKDLRFAVPWLGLGIDFDLRLYHFSSFILLALAGFLLLITVYATAKMKDAPRSREFMAYVFLTAAFANGAVLANNFVPLVFFWEGLLVTLYGLITIGGRPTSGRTAVKALLISGFCDFSMILGIGLLWAASGTATMSEIAVEPVGLAAAAFVLMFVGAAGKAGAMPFHTWIPDAGTDAPVTFMAFLPAAFEKLLGIYLLARISLDFFKIRPGGGLSVMMMIVGAVTIVLAVLMALIQKDLKRLLSYHAISQVGYMILGIGTAIPVGIAGGLFHMINHAMYKSGLFLSAGSVEHRTGTTELRKLGGLRKEMPLTAFGFTVCALAISGVWPLNGFVSKEMIFHGALESGYTVFAIAAWVGAIFTFASFLKAGHSVFFGERTREVPAVKESQPAIVPAAPRPGRPVHPVRRLQQAAPDAVHHADRRAPRRGRRTSRFHQPRPVRLHPGRPHLHRLPRPGLPAPPLRLPEGRAQGLPGLRARPQAPRRPSALRLGRSPGVRSLRAGRQGPPGAVDVPVQGRRPAHRLRLREGRHRHR